MTINEHDFYRRVVELLKRHEKFTICRVVQSIGSAPRNAGAQMLVFPNGAIEFTLGGGAIEGRVIREAVLSLDFKRAFVREYHLGDLGMHCGGIMRVSFEQADPLGSGFYEQIEMLLQERQSMAIAYSLDDSLSTPLPKAIFTRTGVSFGQQPFIEQIRHEAGRLWDESLACVETEAYFIQHINPPWRLLIFGAGHVGSKLAQVTTSTGVFVVDVVDDRPKFTDPQKLAFVRQVTLASHNYEGALPLPDEQTFVAVITRCHATDKVVLQYILESGAPFAYLGMIGSVPKRARLFKFLKEEGISPEMLERVVTPMGLPIGGKMPGEIAVSMLAQMIRRKNEMEGTLERRRRRWQHKLKDPLEV